MDWDVFLSYNRSDQEAVMDIERRLREAGLRPWFDQLALRPGQRWLQEVSKQIETTEAAAVFVGADGLGPWHELEIEALLKAMVERGCTVIPVILAGCSNPPPLPPFFKGLVWVDFREQAPDPLARLISGIQGDRAAKKPAPKKVGLPPNNLPFGTLGEIFEGRQKLLDMLDETFASAMVDAKVQVVNGLAGIGKTRLAIEYAYTHAERFSGIFFVGADSEVDMRRNLAGLVQQDLLNLSIELAASEDSILATVRKALRERPGWLLILDNVDSTSAQLAARRLLPLPGGQVLITSRLQTWPANTKQHRVGELDPQAACNYLLKATEGRDRRGDDEAAAFKLAKNLGHLPLALELTAAYVRENSLAFAELLAAWTKEQQHLVDWFDPAATEYPLSLAATLARSFEKLSQEAQAVLVLFAHLAPEPIPQALFEHSFRNQATLRAALADLQRYSLISRNQTGEQKSLSIHLLVQEVARSCIPTEERPAWAKTVISLLLKYTPFEVYETRTWHVWEPLRPHVARAIELAEETGVVEPTSLLISRFGLLLSRKALYTEAEKLLRRALEINGASPGRDPSEVRNCLMNLAQVLHDTNRLHEAEELTRRALAIDQECFGQDHPNVVTDLNDLAQLLQDTNRLEEAEEIMRRVLAMDETSFGKDHQNVSRDLNNLAQLLQATNRLDEAEPLLRRSLEIERVRFGADNPRVARGLNNLALLLEATNRLDEAETLMRQALVIDEASFGKVHPDVARDLNNLSQLLKRTGRRCEAERHLRRALAIVELRLGAEHPLFVGVQNNLTTLWKELDSP